MDEIRSELRVLREQSRSDFQWTTQALGRQRDVLEDALHRMDDALRRVHGALEAQQETVVELGRRVDARFGQLLDHLEPGFDILQDHERRLRNLEGQPPPAA